MTYEDTTPLNLAAQHGHTHILRRFVAHITDVNTPVYVEARTPLHIAAEEGRFDVVKLLLELDATVDAQSLNFGDETALHAAASSGHTTIMEELLRHGADVHSVTSVGYTPLHIAAEPDHADAARVLLAEGASVNAITMNAKTALHVATEHGHSSVVALLLVHGADANAAASARVTPLHIAARTRWSEIAAELIVHGADIDAMNEWARRRCSLLRRKALKTSRSRGLELAQMSIRHGRTARLHCTSQPTQGAQSLSTRC